jgi:hypothetical protein
MTDYSKNIIYTIKSKDSIYVGSTVNFTSRKNQHKSNIYNENVKDYNYKLYKIIRENDGEWDMKPYSKYPCNDIVEQTIEEERIRILLKADMNSKSCGTGLNRSVLGKQEYEKQYNTEYYTDNKDKILEQHKQYYTENKDKLNKKSKQYYTENKDKHNEYNKQYYTDNKDKLLEQQKQKVKCECGCIIRKSDLSRHKKTKKHLKLMENK